MTDRIFQGLNDQQAAAVSAVRGPVCILAGAGSGKTTTITRRIANQISTGTFAASEVLAVTFTDKAAKEMAARLQRLGVPAVRARTFHAEALALYKAFSSDPSEIIPSKGQVLAGLVKRLPPPHKFTAVRDIATEIEWAKNRCIGPDRYLDVANAEERVTPVPHEVMAGLYKTYERRKDAAGMMDFEDLLARTIEMLSNDERALNAVRSRYRAFTVDEYQDVNLLQQTLLEAWVGNRRDLCVVGDDYQSIFGFTGATPRYLLDFPDRHDDAQVFRLTVNYRSTPQVLNVANRLVPRLGGQPKSLSARAGAEGPEPVFREHATGTGEVEWIVRQCRALRNAGVPWEEMAVLYRINGRSEDLEEAFSADRLPYQVRDGAFLRRPAARALLAKLKRATGPVDQAVDQIVRGLGWQDPVPDDLDASEATRQADLGRLRAIANEFASAHPGASAAAFIEDLAKRFAPERDGRGVQILTYHRSKGLEFEAVFLPRLEEKEIPFALSKTDEEIAEERRLFYVGITRAKKYLFVSWAAQRPGDRRRSPKRSPFIAEIRPQTVPTSGRLAGATPGSVSAETPAKAKVAVGDEHLALFTALKDWRLEAAKRTGVPAYVVFHDQTLARIAEERPGNVVELGRISGVGPTKIQRYGSEVLELIVVHAG